MHHNTKNVRIETPADINEEVKNVLTAIRKKQPQQQLDRLRTPRKLRISTVASTGGKNFQAQNANFKHLTSRSHDTANLSNVTMSERQERPRTSIYPEVQLLNDARFANGAKPIGFRPSWQCEAWNNHRSKFCWLDDCFLLQKRRL